MSMRNMPTEWSSARQPLSWRWTGAGVVEPRGDGGPACSPGRGAAPARAADRPGQQRRHCALLHVYLEAFLRGIPADPAAALTWPAAGAGKQAAGSDHFRRNGGRLGAAEFFHL